MAVLPVPKESKTRQRKKYNGSGERPPKNSLDVWAAACCYSVANGFSLAAPDVNGESNAEAADDCCDDGCGFCFHRDFPDGLLFMGSRGSVG